MQAFQRDLYRFEELSTQVLGVSSDSLETHQRFSREYDLSFALISDSEGEVQKKYSSRRVTYVIDSSGSIRFIQKGIPDNEKLLQELKKLK